MVEDKTFVAAERRHFAFMSFCFWEDLWFAISLYLFYTFLSIKPALKPSSHDESVTVQYSLVN